MSQTEKNKEIIRLWLTGKNSATLVLPREFAKEYGLDQPSHVIIEKRPGGMFIRKLDIEEMTKK